MNKICIINRHTNIDEYSLGITIYGRIEIYYRKLFNQYDITFICDEIALTIILSQNTINIVLPTTNYSNAEFYNYFNILITMDIIFCRVSTTTFLTFETPCYS